MFITKARSTNMTRKRIAFGQTGVIFQVEPSLAVKNYHRDHYDDAECERKVYERVGRHSRILEYFGPGYGGILLRYHPRGFLRQLIVSEQVIPLIKWAEQIAEGLEHIHRHGIIHCDTGATNILVKDDSDIVLCDFAGSSIDGEKKSGVFYERRCARRWSKFFSTPDVDDSFSFTPKDDLFALGSVIYEMSTGNRPHHDKSDADVTNLYDSNVFPDLSGVEMGEIIDKCWRGHYESATEALADIREFIC